MTDASTSTDGSVSRQSRLYAELLTQVRAAGLLSRHRPYYWRLMATVFLLYAAAWAVFVIIGDSWWQVLIAVSLGIISTHVGFIGHDAGHRQIFASRRWNDLVGLTCANVMIGFSYGWWVDKHRRHHLHPNHEELDPDISSDVIAFFPARAQSRGAVGRLICRWQAVIMMLALPLQSFAMRIGSTRFLLGGNNVRRKKTELLLLALSQTIYLVVIFYSVSPLTGMVFVALHQGMLGVYLGLGFAPNHKGMPTVRAVVTDYFHRQVITSRNIRGGRVTDILLGGLNYQIEHHLFPSMPRPYLAAASAIVRTFCASNSVPYVETSVMGSYRAAFRHLHNVWRTPT